MKKHTLLIIFVITYVFLIVCSKKESEDKVEYTSFEDSTVVAIVNGESISSADMEASAKQIILQAGLVNSVDYTDSLIQKQALDWLIANALLRQEVEKHLIEVKDDEVEKAIEAVRRNFSSEQEFSDVLQKENLSVREFREKVVLDLKVQKLLEQEIVSKISDITTEDAKEYYEQNPEKFKEPSKIRARHILIRVKKDATDAVVRKSREKAQFILEKLKKGEDFTELARTFSEDPAAAKGGDLGFFARGDMVKPFEDAVFSLKIGEISDIVRTDFGFHIIKVEDAKDPELIPFTKIENGIKGYLKQMKSNELFEDYVNKLKQKSKIQIKRIV